MTPDTYIRRFRFVFRAVTLAMVICLVVTFVAFAFDTSGFGGAIPKAIAFWASLAGLGLTALRGWMAEALRRWD